MSEFPEVTEVQRLTLKPGDCLAIRVKDRLTAEQAQMLTERAKAMLPEGVKVMILDAGISLEVVTPPDSAAFGRQVIAAIKDWERRHGKGWLA